MEYYFVDYENVNTAGLNGIARLTDEDVVVIFYSENANTMTFGLHRRMNESRAEIRFQKVLSGSRNALDFQLSSYLGYAICENAGKDVTYYVVSKDRGYEVLTKYWKHQKVDVVIVSDLSRRPEEAQSAARKTAEQRERTPNARAPETPEGNGFFAEDGALESELNRLIEDKDAIPTLSRLLRTCRTRQELHGELVRAFHVGANNQYATELYKTLRPLLPERGQET